jgi:hypothetical protein
MDEHDKMSKPVMAEVGFEPGAVIGDDGTPQWVAIVSIVLGVLGLLCWGGQFFMVSVSAMGSMDGAAKMPEMSSAYRVFMVSGYISGVVLGMWLIIAGSGAAAGSSWARSMLRGWAWVRLLVAVAGLVGAWYWFDEVVAQSMVSMQSEFADVAAKVNDNGTSPATSPLPKETVAIITGVAILVQTVIVCVWPMIVLITTRSQRGL